MDEGNLSVHILQDCFTGTILQLPTIANYNCSKTNKVRTMCTILHINSSFLALAWRCEQVTLRCNIEVIIGPILVCMHKCQWISYQHTIIPFNTVLEQVMLRSNIHVIIEYTLDCMRKWQLILYKLDRTQRKAWEICLRYPLAIYSHMFSR